MLKHLTFDFSGALAAPAVNQSGWAERLAGLPRPSFQTYVPDLPALEAALGPYQKYPHIILIGTGGSRTSALAFYHALQDFRNQKPVEFLTTMEPDVIAALKKKYRPDDTLVMIVSKSGINIDVLEPLLQFLDYPVLPVTSPDEGILCIMAKKMGWQIIPHPDVGGRYSGRTECALAPAALMGLDVAAINRGAVNAFSNLDFRAPPVDNPAFQAALICFELEKKGCTEIFTAIYSQALAGFLPLIVQLIHESTGKDGQGQTVFGDQAPESQHHTNQRFFGGRRNVLGLFITVAASHTALSTAVPSPLRELPLGRGTVGDLDGLPLAESLRCDYEGVAETARRLKIPHLTLTLDSITPESVGEFLSFLHYFTLYSALLRDQNPFDQPAVEESKKISLQKRGVGKQRR